MYRQRLGTRRRAGFGVFAKGARITWGVFLAPVASLRRRPDSIGDAGTVQAFGKPGMT
jgi:hypothetical protein